MNNHKRDAFGTEPLGRLLRQQAVPASAGILVMSIYGIVDTFFVGMWVGSLGIAAITVVLPITFLIASIGMAIGVGGAYFQAIGKARPALFLSLSKQGFLLIPLVLTLPLLFGIDGIWMAFPIADAGAALLSIVFLKLHFRPSSE